MSNEHHKKRRQETVLRTKTTRQKTCTSLNELKDVVSGLSNQIFQVDIALFNTNQALAMEYREYLEKCTYLRCADVPLDALVSENFRNKSGASCPVALGIHEDTTLSLDMQRHLCLRLPVAAYESLGVLGQKALDDDTARLVLLDLAKGIPQRDHSRLVNWATQDDIQSLAPSDTPVPTNSPKFSLLFCNMVSTNQETFEYETSPSNFLMDFPNAIEKKPLVTSIEKESLRVPQWPMSHANQNISRLMIALSKFTSHNEPFPGLELDASVSSHTFRAYGLFHPHAVHDILDHFIANARTPGSLLILSAKAHKAAPCHKPARSKKSSWSFPCTYQDQTYGYDIAVSPAEMSIIYDQ